MFPTIKTLGKNFVQVKSPHTSLVISTLKRNIMASPSTRAKKAVEDLETNPYYSKYAQKIAELQKTSPEEFLARLDAAKEEKKTDKAVSEEKREFSSPMQAKPHQVQSYSKPKQLNDVMKVDLVKDKSAEEIQSMWKEYHSSKDSVLAATIPSNIYDKIHQRSLEHPTFLFPLPRSQGYEFIVSQFSGHEVHFTPLISYQTHKENSPECLTITHYTDFKDEKNIVLMKGEYISDVLNASEAQCLANQIQLYYGQDDEKRCQLLDRFTNKPMEFKHMDLIAELECLSI